MFIDDDDESRESVEYERKGFFSAARGRKAFFSNEGALRDFKTISNNNLELLHLTFL